MSYSTGVGAYQAAPNFNDVQDRSVSANPAFRQAINSNNELQDLLNQLKQILSELSSANAKPTASNENKLNTLIEQLKALLGNKPKDKDVNALLDKLANTNDSNEVVRLLGELIARLEKNQGVNGAANDDSNDSAVSGYANYGNGNGI